MPNTSATAASRSARPTTVLTFHEMVELGLIIEEEPFPKMIDATPESYQLTPHAPEVVDLTDDDDDNDDDDSTSQSIEDLIKGTSYDDDDDLLNEIFSRDDVRQPADIVESAPSTFKKQAPLPQSLVAKRGAPQELDDRPLKKIKTWNLLGRQIQPVH